MVFLFATTEAFNLILMGVLEKVSFVMKSGQVVKALAPLK